MYLAFGALLLVLIFRVYSTWGPLSPLIATNVPPSRVLLQHAQLTFQIFNLILQNIAKSMKQLLLGLLQGKPKCNLCSVSLDIIHYQTSSRTRCTRFTFNTIKFSFFCCLFRSRGREIWYYSSNSHETVEKHS